MTTRLRATLTASILVVGACATLQQIAALRRVDFAIDRVSGATLAGVSMNRVGDPGALSAADVSRIAAALARGALPFAFRLHLEALNPAENEVPARLLALDWELLLEDRETVSGRLDREFVLEPGVRQEIPLDIQVDLADFFERGAGDMIDLALAVTGAGGEPTSVALRATPTIQTPVGPIPYLGPITIVSRELGGR